MKLQAKSRLLAMTLTGPQRDRIIQSLIDSEELSPNDDPHSMSDDELVREYKRIHHVPDNWEPSMLLASAGRDSFNVKVSYDDPTGKGIASTSVLIRDCTDAEQARRLFNERYKHHYKNPKITSVIKVKNLQADAGLERWLHEMADMHGAQGNDEDGRATVMDALRKSRDRNPVIIVVGDGTPKHVFTLGPSNQIATDSLHGLYDDARTYKCEYGGKRCEFRTLAVIDVDDFMDHYSSVHASKTQPGHKPMEAASAIGADLKNAITSVVVRTLKVPTPKDKVITKVLADPTVKNYMKATGAGEELVKTYAARVWDEFEAAVDH